MIAIADAIQFECFFHAALGGIQGDLSLRQMWLAKITGRSLRSLNDLIDADAIRKHASFRKKARRGFRR